MINKANIWFFEKVNKIDKTSIGLIKNENERNSRISK